MPRAKAKKTPWKNRIVGEDVVAARSLTANPSNWRTHPSGQRAALGQVLTEVGWVQSVIVNRTTGHIVDGHLRVEEAAARDEDVPVTYVDLTEDEERLMLLSLDPLAAMAEADATQLRSLLDGIDATADLADLLSGLQDMVPLPTEPSFPWQPKDDTADPDGDHVVERYGWNVGSIWLDPEGNESAPYWQHMLQLPKNQTEGEVAFKQRYSRTALWALDHIVRLYMQPGDRFFEVCIGWATFSSVAKWYGYSGAGCDIWDVSLDFARRQLRAIPGDAEVEVLEADARAVPVEDGSFDFAYCNPPFWNVETYQGDGADLSAVASYEDWLGQMHDLTAETMRIVKPGGLLVFAMADFRHDKALVTASADWLQLAKGLGLQVHDLAVSEVKTQRFRLRKRDAAQQRCVKAHEYVLVFRNPG